MWKKQSTSLIFRTKQFGTFRSKMGNTFKRQWTPNVHYQVLYSPTLKRDLGNILPATLTTSEERREKRQRKEGLRVSCWALRTIDQCGGIDPFLLTMPKEKLMESDLAMKLRKEIITTLKATITNEDQLRFINKIE